MAGLTQQQFAVSLQSLGLRTGDAVMMHSSLSALGPVDGGAKTIIDGIFDVIGSGGTLLVPAFRDNLWENLANFKNTDCSPCPQRLCPSRQSGFQGVIAEEARHRQGSLRSCHPTHSWVALGSAAEKLLATHHQSLTPCGAGNPFEPLLALDGCILTLGVGVDRVTLWHYYEEKLGVPYVGHYWPKERHLSHCAAGLRFQYEFPGIIQDVCRASGILKTGSVGKSISGLMRARDFDGFMATAFANDPFCLVLRPPDRICKDFALDALEKGAGMLRAWKKGPQRSTQTPTRELGQVLPAGPGDPVRQDCPAFAGFYRTANASIPLCLANGRHPDYFRLGGAFDQNGLATCGSCSWHQKFPKN